MELTTAAAQSILGHDDVEVALIRRANDMWRLTAGDDAFYLKAHTKDWYGGRADNTVVRREVSAYRWLADQGLPTPEIVAVSTDSDNPLGWPGTRAEILHHLLSATDWAELFDLRRIETC